MTTKQYLDTLKPTADAYEYDGITDYRWVLKKDEKKAK
jgi:hypothetical protein